MALGRTAQYYRDNPAANARRLAQQKAYDTNGSSSGMSAKQIKKKRAIRAKWKRDNKGSKPKGAIVEAVHTKGDPNGRIRWAVGEQARKENRGNEVRKRNSPSNPQGGRRIALADRQKAS